MRRDKKSILKKSYSYSKNGWIFLHIEGEPYERGFQHGYTLANKLAIIFPTLKSFTFQTTGKEFSFFMKVAKDMFQPRVEKEFLEELKGIVDGAERAGVSIPLEALLAWNGYIELTYNWWPFFGLQGKRSRIEHCSAFIATGDATKNKEIILGHNTWWDFIIGQYFNIILDIEPTNGNRIFMQSVPGYIHSQVDFFINGAGIVGASTTIVGFNQFDESGEPEFSRVRRAMQYGTTIDGWVSLMQKGNNGGCANSWLLGDTNTNEVAQFEQGLQYTSLKTTVNGYYTGYNAADDPQIRNLECTDSEYNDVRGNGARRVRWEQLMEEYYGDIDLEIGKTMLRDHHDIYLDQEYPSNRTICGHSDVDPYQFGGGKPYSPDGALDGKVVSSRLAKEFTFWAKHGRSCDVPFYAEEFIKCHPQWSWQKDFLQDRLPQPWTLFSTQI